MFKMSEATFLFKKAMIWRCVYIVDVFIRLKNEAADNKLWRSRSNSVPVVSYCVPVVSYGVPVVSHSVPVVTYSVPVVFYSVPVVSYSVPVVSYSVPVVSYSVPVVFYSVPEVSYSVPVVSGESLHQSYVFSIQSINQSVIRWPHLLFSCSFSFSFYSSYQYILYILAYFYY